MKNRIIEILKEIRSDIDFNIDTDFIESGMLDSFDIVSFVTTIDEEFNISINGTDILPENFQSIDAIMQLLSKYNIKS
jgi:acyl carrier protein